MPMSKFSTLDYLINSYQAGKREVELFHFASEISENYNVDFDQIGFEPSQSSIDAILNFATQYEVLQSRKTGNIELNLN
jgi:hypothetical protein